MDGQQQLAARSVVTNLPIDAAAIGLEAGLGILEVARSEHLTACHAAYVDLALSRSLGPATIDERLAAACRTVGVPLIS